MRLDVAVISKGDGFIWIDRKQYFRPELNDHFFQNYYGNRGSQGNGPTPDEEGDKTMAIRKTEEKGAKPGGAFASSGLAEQIDKLVERNPRLARLAKSIRQDRDSISEEQREFLEDFADEVGKGARERRRT